MGRNRANCSVGSTKSTRVTLSYCSRVCASMVDRSGIARSAFEACTSRSLISEMALQEDCNCVINRSAGVDGDAENSGAREATIYIHQTCYLLAPQSCILSAWAVRYIWRRCCRCRRREGEAPSTLREQAPLRCNPQLGLGAVCLCQKIDTREQIFFKRYTWKESTGAATPV